jgi:hypothetical protein
MQKIFRCTAFFSEIYMHNSLDVFGRKTAHPEMP